MPLFFSGVLLVYFSYFLMCLFYSFYFSCCVIICLVRFSHFYSFFFLSFSFIYFVVASMCILLSSLCLWLCVCVCVLFLYSASSRSSPCLDHDNSRWSLYFVYFLISFVPLLLFLCHFWMIFSFPSCFSALFHNECPYITWNNLK